MRYRRTGQTKPAPKGGRTFQLITEEIGQFLIEEVERNPAVTLKELRHQLGSRFPVAKLMSSQSISKFLDEQLITMKKLVHTPIQWNQQAVKVERREFFEWLMNEGLQQNLVFQDETGFNLWTVRTRGRARRGEAAVRILGGQRGQNVTVLLAVSPKILSTTQ